MNKSFARSFHRIRLHPNQWLRLFLGFVLIIAGILGPFVPVLGVWMIPLGLVLMFPNSPWYKHYVNWCRLRRRLKESRS